MAKISISLIHNNDRERLAYVRPNIQDLANRLRERHSVETYEFSFQPILRPVSTITSLQKDFIDWKLRREWDGYKRVPRTFLLKDASIVTVESLKRYLDKESSAQWRNMRAKEIYLTDKHIKSLKNALDIGSDYMISFEDDVIFEPGSIDNVSALIDGLEAGETRPAYVDLAGGCRPEDLGYDDLELKRDGRFIYYSKPVTNTICAYLANRKQLSLFGYFLGKISRPRNITADWLFNKIFIMQARAGIESVCFHAYPHLFKHGSVTGDRQSSMRQERNHT